MVDYSFMKTGFNNLNTPNNTNNTNNTNNFDVNKFITSTILLFTENALVNAGKYVKISKRNGITELDIKYALIFEVFEFLKQNNIQDKINSLQDQIDNDEYNSDNEDEDKDEDEDDQEDNNLIIKDEEIDDFKRVNIDEVNNEDKEFVEKIHNYYDNWDSWIPETDIQQILKNAINKI